MKSRLSELNRRMFENVGGAIKKIARIECWIGIVVSLLGGIGTAVSLITAISTLRRGVGSVLLGVLLGILACVAITLLGGVLSWLSSLMLYGFGEIVEMAVRDRNGSAPRPRAARPAPQRRPVRRSEEAEWIEEDADWRDYRR